MEGMSIIEGHYRREGCYTKEDIIQGRDDAVGHYRREG